jgi:hypothetical protein
MILRIGKRGEITAVERGRELTKLERRCFEAAWILFAVVVGISIVLKISGQ